MPRRERTFEFTAFISAKGRTEAEARDAAEAACAFLSEEYSTDHGDRVEASLDDSEGLETDDDFDEDED